MSYFGIVTRQILEAIPSHVLQDSVSIWIRTGAIVGGADDTAQAKMKILAENGIHVVSSPAKIGVMVASVLK